MNRAKPIPAIPVGTTVGVANYTALAQVVERTKPNFYLVRFTTGRKQEFHRNQLSRWDAKAGRCFKFS